MTIKHANTQQHPVVYDCPCHRHLNPPTSSSSASSSISTRKTQSTRRKVDRTRIIPRSELASRIINGENLVIYNDLVLDLTRWADKHPGGKLAVLHFVGRDATDEMDAYHSKKDLRRVGGFVVGRVDDREPYKPLTPPISLGLIRDPESATGWRREGPTRLYAQHEDLGKKDARGEGGYYPVLTREALEPVEVEVDHVLFEDRDHDRKNSDGSGDEDRFEDHSSSGSSSGSRVDGEIDIPISLHPTPPIPRVEKIDLKREHARSLAYRQLRTRLEHAGLFQAEGWHKGYAGDLGRYTILAGLAAGFYFWSTSTWGLFCSAVFLGAFWHQLTFLAHDAGHTGITGQAGKDRLIGTVVANWVGGLSLSWWKDNHNIHHLVTNHPEHDPDIQHIPFFAISTDFFGNLWSTYYKRVMPFDGFSNMMVKVQHKVYYVVLAFARFNLYANSYGYLALKMPRNKWFAFELAGLVFFWTWFGMLLKGLDGWKMRVGYLLVSHIVTSPVHVQIVLSHFARSTADLGPSESFVSRQLRTTMDVVCNEWIEFFHGGLHLQVTHHLFPRIPRHNLRRASKLVKEYCQEQEIEYAEYSFTEGNKRVLGVLKDVADQVSLLTKVAEADARGELH